MNQSQWHITQNGAPQGPFTEQELAQRVQSGQLKPTDFAWRQGMPQWAPATSIPGLFPASGSPPPLPPAAGAPVANYYAPPPPGLGRDIGQDAGIRMLLPVGRSGWAIAAGYLGLFSFIILPAPLALIISIVAITDIRKHPDRHGMGRAIFGLIMGIIGTIIFVPMIIAFVFHR